MELITPSKQEDVMKFPKSVHAEGWLDHIDTTAPEHLPEALKPGKNRFIKPADALAKPASTETEGMQRPRVYMSSPAEGAAPKAPPPTMSAPAAPVITAPRRPSATPWVVGGGVALAVVALAMSLSRNLPSRDSTAVPPTVTGEAKPSPEDAQLAAAPTAAGPVTPEPASPAATPPAPEPQQPSVVAAAPTPAPTPAPAPKAQAPQPAPVAKTLAPKPEVMAQASPPPVTLRDPVAPVAPTVTPSTPPTTTPEQATPTVPPVAQAQPTPDPAVADDAGVTVKVRTALATDAMLSAVPIAVSTDHGVVKLEGQVPDTQARERATVVAAATQGVKAVDNRLTVPPVATLSQAPSSL